MARGALAATLEAQEKAAADAAEAEAREDLALQADEDNEYDVVDSRPREARRTPVFAGCKVVYMGAATNKSVTLVGRLLVENIENDEPGPDGKPTYTVLKTCTDEGTTPYDFTTRDSRGAIIRTRLMPAKSPLGTANRPFAVVEHPEHLHTFQRMRNGNESEFLVLVPRSIRADYEEFVRRRERTEADRASLFEETAKR